MSYQLRMGFQILIDADVDIKILRVADAGAEVTFSLMRILHRCRMDIEFRPITSTRTPFLFGEVYPLMPHAQRCPFSTKKTDSGTRIQ